MTTIILLVRYPTAGSSSMSEAQPFYVNSPYGIVFAHVSDSNSLDPVCKKSPDLTNRENFIIHSEWQLDERSRIACVPG